MNSAGLYLYSKAARKVNIKLTAVKKKEPDVTVQPCDRLS